MKKIIKIWGKESGQSRIDEIRGRSVYLGGAYEEKLARAKSLQSGKTSILAVRQSVPGFIRNLQGSDIGDVLVPRHVPIKLETRFHRHNLARQIYKGYMCIYIFFPNLYSDVVPVKLNLPPETPGVKPGHAFDPRLQPLPRLGRDPEPLIDVHIGIQWQSASMKVEGVENLVADHRSESRVRGIRWSTVPGPGPGRHHRQWDAWNRRATFSLLEQRSKRTVRKFLVFTNRVRRRFVVGVHAVGMTTPAKVNLISNMRYL